MSTPPLAKDELVQLEMRKHWFVILAEVVGYLLVYLVPFFAYVWLSGKELLVGDQEIVLTLTTPMALFLISLWTLLIWMRVVGLWTDYYLDVWTVTNKRIIDVEQKGFFHRQTSIFRIERIQDVTIETKGLIPTLLNFGDIHVQTAGEAQEFTMRGIAKPKYVRETILKQQDRSTDAMKVDID